jgi:hypothetical protein
MRDHAFSFWWFTLGPWCWGVLYMRAPTVPRYFRVWRIP